MTETTLSRQRMRDCCRDFARATASRRSLLQGALMVGGTMAVTQLLGESMLQATFAGTPGGNTLVVLSLRGGIDGLGVVVPHGDPGYYTARPTTAVPKASLLGADSMFGLHPNMAPLQSLWELGRARRHPGRRACAVPNRSHFSAIEEVEDADPGSSARSGWINRMIGLGSSAGTLDGVQLGMNFPTSAMIGPRQLLATTDLEGLQVSAIDGTNATRRYASLATAWAGATGPLAVGAAEAVVDLEGGGRDAGDHGRLTVAYPTHGTPRPFAEPLESAAKLIKADLGTDVIAIDAGSWDLHTGYGNVGSGTMQQNISGLATRSPRSSPTSARGAPSVTVVTISEFGRRVAENGSRGFDHGWGNMMLVAGAGVKGGQYYGTLDPAADRGGRRPGRDHGLPQRPRRDRRPALPRPVGALAVPGPVLRPGRLHGLTSRGPGPSRGPGYRRACDASFSGWRAPSAPPPSPSVPAPPPRRPRADDATVAKAAAATYPVAAGHPDGPRARHPVGRQADHPRAAADHRARPQAAAALDAAATAAAGCGSPPRRCGPAARPG